MKTGVQQALAHVYWLGGSPCAGKSSVADALAAKYAWQLYCCDEAYERHLSIITPAAQPTLSRLSALTGDALWMRPHDQQLCEELQLYQEEFPLILADLLALPKRTPVLVEGNALLPRLISPLLVTVRQALWMVPVPEFQLQYYARRTWAKEVVASCTYPEQAFANWMQRDISFAACIVRQTIEQELTLLQVDGSRSLAETIELVEHHFMDD